MQPSEFENLEPAELYDIFDGYGWRMRREAIVQAYHIAALIVGTKDLPDLSELLAEDEPNAEATPEEYHRRLRELGLE